MLLFALSIAPGLAISLYIFFKDKFNKEPKLKLFVCFLLGCLSTIPALIFQLVTTPFLDWMVEGGILHSGILAFALVGVSEECSKFMMMRLYAYPKPTFDEPFDGIVYFVMVGMGVATLENILYVYQHGIGTAFLRMFVSVPAHGTFAVLMGYYVGMAKFKPERRSILLLKGVLSAIAFHGVFNFFLFLSEYDYVTDIVGEVALFGGALLSFITALILSKRAINLHHQLSKTTFEDSHV